MTNSRTLLRRIAIWLTRRTERMLPESQCEWSQAMLGELEHIEGDGEALQWAIGCFAASYVAHLRTQPPLELLPVRMIVTLLLIWHVFNDLFASALTLAYKTHQFQLAEQLGRLTPHGDYRPLIPLLDAVPLWVYVMSMIAAVAYGVSAIRYLRRSWSPLIPFVLGFTVDVIVWALLQPIEGDAAVSGDNANSLLFCFVSLLAVMVLWRRTSTAPRSM